MSKFLLCLLLSVQSFILSNFISKPDVKLPQNVYYIAPARGDDLQNEKAVCVDQDFPTKPFISLRDAYIAKGYKFYTSLPDVIDDSFRENVSVIFWQQIPWPPMFEKLKTVLHKVVIIIIEPPNVMPTNFDPVLEKPFSKILTWDDTRIDNKKYFKHYPVQSNLVMIDKIIAFHDKKLCTLIASNKQFSGKLDSWDRSYELYSKRREAILFFDRFAANQFDLYGYGWEKAGYKTYKGIATSKTETLKKYRFAICYENCTNLKGWVSEKIFGCFIAGCVPVYLGADNILNYVPPECFIDKRKFSSLNDLYVFISSMKEEEYNRYLANIRKYLLSEQAQKFSIDYFIENLMSIHSQML